MPDEPTTLGYRLTLGDDVYEVRFGDLTAAQARTLRLATLDPRAPGSEWTEQTLLQEWQYLGLSMEGQAAHVFLAMLQRGERPNFVEILNGLRADTPGGLEEITTEEVDAADPPA